MSMHPPRKSQRAAIWFLLCLSLRLLSSSDAFAVRPGLKRTLAIRRARNVEATKSNPPLENEIHKGIDKAKIFTGEDGKSLKKYFTDEQGKMMMPTERGLMEFIMKAPIGMKKLFCRGYISALDKNIMYGHGNSHHYGHGHHSESSDSDSSESESSSSDSDESNYGGFGAGMVGYEGGVGEYGGGVGGYEGGMGGYGGGIGGYEGGMGGYGGVAGGYGGGVMGGYGAGYGNGAYGGGAPVYGPPYGGGYAPVNPSYNTYNYYGRSGTTAGEGRMLSENALMPLDNVDYNSLDSVLKKHVDKVEAEKKGEEGNVDTRHHGGFRGHSMYLTDYCYDQMAADY